MPSLQRIVPHPVHMSGNGKNAGIENGESAARNTDTLPEIARDEESNGNAPLPLPQVVDECTPLQCTGVDDDDDEENNNLLKSSVISDKTNHPSTDEGPEGGNAPSSRTARTALEKQVHVDYSPQNSTPTQQPNSDMPRHQSQTNAPTFIPSLERFYAFCINEASSIENLEHIRCHLLILLDKVNGSLTEMRVKESLVNSTSGGITIDELSTEGLMNRFSRDVEKSTSPNGKRGQCEEVRRAETINDDTKRQCRSRSLSPENHSCVGAVSTRRERDVQTATSKSASSSSTTPQTNRKAIRALDEIDEEATAATVPVAPAAVGTAADDNNVDNNISDAKTSFVDDRVRIALGRSSALGFTFSDDFDPLRDHSRPIIAPFKDIGRLSKCTWQPLLDGHV